MNPDSVAQVATFDFLFHGFTFIIKDSIYTKISL